ncbi:hypothetical protein K469DRAFT_702481 [Zopfia rhizophila CBS 207.26]|uniref:Uncharacterized protein n=1 Tax=Zopfia rhizophila CBS 207.26 TaxID=1314779 RepID=A0A6A6EF53_9PEZI|nr:hypothetical protein K469DRAFT_702481 [Zopfia rhizophila CBS 207.26]
MDTLKTALNTFHGASVNDLQQLLCLEPTKLYETAQKLQQLAPPPGLPLAPFTNTDSSETTIIPSFSRASSPSDEASDVPTPHCNNASLPYPQGEASDAPTVHRDDTSYPSDEASDAPTVHRDDKTSPSDEASDVPTPHCSDVSSPYPQGEASDAPTVHRDDTSSPSNEANNRPTPHCNDASSPYPQREASNLTVHRDDKTSPSAEASDVPTPHCSDVSSPYPQGQASDVLTIYRDDTSSLSDEASDAPTVHRDDTSSPLNEASNVPIPHCNDNSSPDKASDAHTPHASPSPRGEFPLYIDEFLDRSGCEAILSTLDSLYDDIQKFVCREVPKAVGGPLHERQDYRVQDLISGTSARDITLETKFRATLSERNFALGFEQWQLAKSNASRVQDILKDTALATRKTRQVAKFLRDQGFSGNAGKIVKAAIRRGTWNLVLERMLENAIKTDADGVTALSVFVQQRRWQMMPYANLAGFIYALRLEKFSRLLDLIKAVTPFMKEAQAYYDSLGYRGTKRFSSPLPLTPKRQFLGVSGITQLPQEALSTGLVDTSLQQGPPNPQAVSINTTLAYMPAPPLPRTTRTFPWPETPGIQCANTSRSLAPPPRNSNADTSNSQPSSHSFAPPPPAPPRRTQATCTYQNRNQIPASQHTHSTSDSASMLTSAPPQSLYQTEHSSVNSYKPPVSQGGEWESNLRQGYHDSNSGTLRDENLPSTNTQADNFNPFGISGDNFSSFGISSYNPNPLPISGDDFSSFGTSFDNFLLFGVNSVGISQADKSISFNISQANDINFDSSVHPPDTLDSDVLPPYTPDSGAFPPTQRYLDAQCMHANSTPPLTNV